MRITLVLVFALAACDSRAKASDPEGSRADQKSKEYESCAASVQCADGLRCYERTCRRTARSNVGDYYAALGAAKRASGDLDAAVEAYAHANDHYNNEKVGPTVPPDITCGYGGALAANNRKKENAELGARWLHRCLLALGPGAGGALRDKALADLALLADAGLEPLAIGRTAEGDIYLRGGPAKPATDKLAVAVGASPTPSTKGYLGLNDKLNEAGNKDALIACWTAYNAATKKDALVVNIGVKIAYAQNPDYEDEGGWITKIEPPSGLAAGSPEAAGDACVRAVVEPAFKDLKLREGLNTKLAIAIKSM
jgi:hypothetical protein